MVTPKDEGIIHIRAPWGIRAPHGTIVEPWPNSGNALVLRQQTMERCCRNFLFLFMKKIWKENK
jgi:hypothetical protein